MKRFIAQITVLPKEGVLDTQGKAVEKTLAGAGYAGIGNVRVGKIIRFDVEAEDEDAAGALAREVSDDLLVNDLIESYTYSMEERP